MKLNAKIMGLGLMAAGLTQTATAADLEQTITLGDNTAVVHVSATIGHHSGCSNQQVPFVAEQDGSTITIKRQPNESMAQVQKLMQTITDGVSESCNAEISALFPSTFPDLGGILTCTAYIAVWGESYVNVNRSQLEDGQTVTFVFEQMESINAINQLGVL